MDPLAALTRPGLTPGIFQLGASPLLGDNLALQRLSLLDPTNALAGAAAQQNVATLNTMLLLLASSLLNLMPNAPVQGGSPNQSGTNVAPNGETNTQSNLSNQSSPTKIGSGSKVLEIGDSHTVGAFGTELQHLLESKGAQVHKEAAVGTSAGQWVRGGQGAKPIEQLLKEQKYDVVLINLGANFRKGGPGAFNDVKKLAEAAKNSGAQVIWVGPPTTREDQGNPGALQKFDEEMKAALAPYGTYISSAPFTPTYKGPDGIHLDSDVAKKWAQGVAGAIT